MLLHRSGQVALQAALLLAVEEIDVRSEPRRVRELVPKLGVSAAYLAKILHELARAGVLRSVRGPGGGFRLARPAREITLWHVLAAVEPVNQLNACLLGLGGCDGDAACPLHKEWVPIRSQILTLLQSKTLAEVATEAKQGSLRRLVAVAPLHPPSDLGLTDKQP